MVVLRLHPIQVEQQHPLVLKPGYCRQQAPLAPLLHDSRHRLHGAGWIGGDFLRGVYNQTQTVALATCTTITRQAGSGAIGG